MHHCALYSSLSIANHREALPAWRQLVTDLALKHDFLRHAIFSVTSVQLAILQPSAVNTKIAMQHYSTAIKLAVPQLAAITEENASALGVFSRVLPLYVRGLTKVLPTIDPIAQTCEDFHLVRGIAALGRRTQQWSNPLLSNEFLLPHFSNRSVSLPKEIEDQLSILSTHNHETTPDDLLRESIDEAIALLRYSFFLLQEHPKNLTISAPFAMLVSQRFIRALETHEPMALTVLSHFALVTHSLRGIMWMQGWGKQVIEAVAKLLPAEWQTCIEWPLNEISDDGGIIK
jgi:hypothetical protein